MVSPIGIGRKDHGRDDRLPNGQRWRVAIPVELERRLYFVAALIATFWYLLDRLL